jgi:hypothetical protein
VRPLPFPRCCLALHRVAGAARARACACAPASRAQPQGFAGPPRRACFPRLRRQTLGGCLPPQCPAFMPGFLCPFSSCAWLCVALPRPSRCRRPTLAWRLPCCSVLPITRWLLAPRGAFASPSEACPWCGGLRVPGCVSCRAGRPVRVLCAVSGSCAAPSPLAAVVAVLSPQAFACLLVLLRFRGAAAPAPLLRRAPSAASCSHPRLLCSRPSTCYRP